ncbi:MAG TPA: DNA polymerase III subunit alpha [Bacillaceae bacterium]|nr:DNA polymerase III subunit alpha [Bacillaceae bacterium]
MTFAHLQISTAYSLLSSTISIPALVKQAKEYDYKALAITDHNTLYGVLSFYKACVQAKIKPIIGMTADIEGTESNHTYSIILLARNNNGYKNLLKISSVIKTSPDKRISIKWLKAYSKGLIAISPGENGEIESTLLAGNIEQASIIANNLKSVFEPGSFYLSLQNHGEENLIAEIEKISQQQSIPYVATNDVRYLHKGDRFASDCMAAIRDGFKLHEIEIHHAGEKYFKNQEEMISLFSQYRDAIHNTMEIVDKCNVMIETNQQLLPKYPLPEGETAATALKKLCYSEIEKRQLSTNPEYIKRLKYELSIIDKMGFNDYFLIVWDFMKYAREQHILTGPGRGSAAGSLVSYLLGITDIDPLEHGLLFERFLNPERVSMPDIDIDFPDHRRDDVIQYVMNKYGKLHVAQIITFGTFAAKAALRDTARVFGLSSQEMEQLSKFIPGRLGITLKDAYKESKGLQEFVAASEQKRLLYETALKLEGLPRHTSTHAAGVVISEQPLTDLIPIQGGEAGTYLTQFPMEELEEIGLLKMDFLGLRNLTLIEQILKSIEYRVKKKIQIKEIPLHDEKTFALLRRGDTTGIFQLESEGMRKVLRQLKPTQFEDIVAVNALYRPGPMENIPEYIAGKHGKKIVEYLHPDLEPILKITYGVIVYQEQIMQIASKMAGFSLGEADLLRRAVSKKKKEVLDKERNHFVKGACQKGYSEEVANKTYDLIVRFANYGFNRSHAVAYSHISWQLSYLKANYPLDFMAALLTSAIGNDDKIASYISEAKNMGMEILPPSINASQFRFLPEQNGIRYSLSAIRSIGATAYREIMKARKTAPFKDLFDFCLRVSAKAVNRKVLESLVYSGAFDEFGQDRAVLLASLDIALEHAELMRPTEAETDLFEDDELFQLKPKYIEREPIGIAEKLQLEKQALGVYISDHPTSMYERVFLEAGTIPLIQLTPGQRKVSSGVYITNVKPIRTKKGDLMAFVTISDPSGEMDAVAFPDTYKNYLSTCKEGEIVLINGNIEERSGKLQFIIQKLQPASQLINKQSTSNGTLYIKISNDFNNQKILQDLQHILEGNRGDTKVIVHYESTKRTIKLAEKDWINPSRKCLSELEALLGKQNVILK